MLAIKSIMTAALGLLENLANAPQVVKLHSLTCLTTGGAGRILMCKLGACFYRWLSRKVEINVPLCACVLCV